MKTFNFKINQDSTELTIKSQNKLIFSIKFNNKNTDNYIKFNGNDLIIGVNDTCMMETTFRLNYCEVMGLKHQIKNAYYKK